MNLLPRKISKAYLRVLLLTWLAVVAGAYTYCLAHTLVHEHASVIPEAANVWLLSRWLFWPYILPISFWVYAKLSTRLSITNSVVGSGIATLFLAATNANLVNNFAGIEEDFLSTFYYMMPIALGAYTLFVASSLLYVRNNPEPVEAEEPEELTIVVNKGRTIVWLKASEVEWMQSSRNYIDVHADGQIYILRKTLAKMAEELPADQFVRIHRSYIVNKQAIEGMNKNRDGSAVVLMKDGSELPCARGHKEALGMELAPAS